MPEATLPPAPEGAPAAAAAPAPEFVKLVNTGRAPYDILPGKNGRLLPSSQNALLVPKALADKLRRNYPTIKDILDIFPDSVNVDALKAENAALKTQAAALTRLLGASDADKAALADKLADFQAAKNKSDLDAVKEKHADAEAAPAA